jgi:hypothetical protein
MLTPGNRKLGERLIWSFSLPSGHPDVCVGLTSQCQRHCYARRLERLRPDVRARYEANLILSRRGDFALRVRSFILAHEISVVRVHTGGDFTDPIYAQKWLQVMQQLSEVRFFFYTRSWRDDAVRPVLEQLAALPNCRAWYSVDAESGLPTEVPVRVRLAWFMTRAEEVPPPGTNLVFRTPPLRRQITTRVGGVRVCPEEDGVPRCRRVTCDRCTLCWRPLPAPTSGRIPLPVCNE